MLNISDEELLQAFISKADTDAYGKLFQRYIPLVYGLSLKYLENKNLAEDAVMDIFENTLLHIASYEVKNYKNWLYSVAKNHCLQQLRKEKKIIFVNIEDVNVENNDFLNLMDKTQSEEEINALNFCLKELSEEQKISVNYFFIEEKSYADIVELTGYALNKVKSYIQNGKRNLKNCMTKILASTSV